MIKPKDTISNITPYETDKYLYNWDYKLDSNENFYGADDVIVSAIKNFDPKKISLYPCYGELVDKLAKTYSLSDNEILLTNGCDEALSLLISTYLDKGDEILSYNPSFSMPLLYAKAQGGKIKLIDYDEKYIFDPQKFEENIDNNVKIAYVATPNNPTGEVIEADKLYSIIKNHPDTLFIIDCTYVNYSYKVKFEDYISLLKYENTAVVKSFSKDFALAGLRLGYILSNQEIIKNLKKVSSPYNVNAIAAFSGLKALENQNNFEKIKEKNKSCYQTLFEALVKLNYKPYESEANFILCDFFNHKDFIYNTLKNEGIIVRTYSKDSPLSTSLRITLPNEKGIKKIIELITPKPLYVFDMDGVLFDVSKSYRQAIIQTYKFYTGKDLEPSAIQEVKNKTNGMSNDWKVTHFLLNQAGVDITYEKTIETFQNLFYDIQKPIGQRGLIDKEELVFEDSFFLELKKGANCAVFTSREQEEAFYSLEKSDIKKYFSYFITSEVVKDKPKPSPYGLEVIKKHCPYTKMFYFGDTIDDIKAGVDASVAVFGIIPPNASAVDETIKKLTEMGANGVFKNPNEIIKADLINKKEISCV